MPGGPIAAICLLCLIPFYILLVLALNSPQRVFYEGNIFVPDFCWQNFADAWAKSKIGTAMLNSAIITAGSRLHKALHPLRFDKGIVDIRMQIIAMVDVDIIQAVPLRLFQMPILVAWAQYGHFMVSCPLCFILSYDGSL